MKISEATTVAEIVSRLPSSARVFQRYGIDFCCGGKTPLGVACEEQGLPYREVVSAIETAASTPGPEEPDWNRAPLHALIDHIVRTYHDPLREELPRLESMATRVARVHGANASYLEEVEGVVQELAADLQAHMQKEETVLFPAIRAIDVPGGTGFPILAPIEVMEREHQHAGALLSKLRAITGGYVAPDWACATFQALYRGLSELESTMHVHVHLENNVLFPRALATRDPE